MTKYIRMEVATGAVDTGAILFAPPLLPNGGMEVKGFRWLGVVDNVLSPWQSDADFPGTVATDATTISRSVNTPTLANWKKRRVADIRAEQWNRIGATYPLGQVMAYYATAIRLTFKKANGSSLTAGETTTMNNINTVVTGTIEPISTAADTASAAILAAADFAAAEAAYNAVIWP